MIDSWLWVMEPPQPLLTQEGLQTISPRTLRISLWSAFASYALANAYLDLPRTTSLRHVHPFSQWLSNLGLTAALFLLMIIFIYQIVRMTQDRPVPFRTLLSIAAVAMIPLHLALPLALVCHPFHVKGLLFYSLGEMAIGVAVLRRMAWGLQAASGWSFWAAGLAIISPFLIAGLGVLLLGALFMMTFFLLVLGFLN